MTFKRGNVYWYKFWWSVRQPDGTSPSFLIRRSARTGNQRHAREMEEEHRRALRLGESHPSDPWPKPPVPEPPSLKEFAQRFLEHAGIRVKEGSLRNYTVAVNRLLAFPAITTIPMQRITGEVIARYVRLRVDAGESVATINGDLRTLRRMLRLANEWEVIPRAPIIHELPAAKGRDRVLSFDEEARYLASAGVTLKVLAILAVDTGLRPNSELFCLEWDCVDLEPAECTPYGAVRVRSGKTDNAVRVVPLTPRGKQALLEVKARQLHRRWVFPGAGNSGHIVTIQTSHYKAIRRAGLKSFQFYCWRHTFGTRCAESGMDRFTLAKLMGHSSPRISERYYVHITEPHVTLGFEKFLAYQSSRLTGSQLIVH